MAFVSFFGFPSEAIEEPKSILVTATSLIAGSFGSAVLHQELFITFTHYIVSFRIRVYLRVTCM